MTAKAPLNRRQFFRTSAAFSVGSGLIGTGTSDPGPFGLGISRLSAAEVGETEHFLYRLAPEWPYIDSQRGHKAFGFTEGRILLSEDNGTSWPHRADFADTDDLMFSTILDSGSVVFATRRKIYVSTDNLASYRELTVRDRHGKDYRPHDPVDPNRPGSYFYSLDGVHTFETDAGEMLIWGNYCNVRHGPTPVNIYYSTDQGETIKIAYSFGQNPHFQQRGANPAAYIGDPENPVLCRHVHSVSYNPAEKAFYACSGDLARGHGMECHWLRGTYNAATDTWDWQVQVSSDANSRYKSGGINFADGQLYWVADANGPKTPTEKYDRGVFRCDPADLSDKSKHTSIYDAQYELAVMTIDDGVILAPEYGNANPCDTGFLYSPDLGMTWGRYDLKEFGDRSGVRVNPRNSEGWFRVCLRERWMNRAEVLFIKPKV